MSNTYGMYPANWGGDHERQYATAVKRYCQRCGLAENTHWRIDDHKFVANDDVGELHKEPIDWEARARAVEDLFSDEKWLRLSSMSLHQIRDRVRALLKGEGVS